MTVQFYMGSQDEKIDCSILSNGQSLSCKYRFQFSKESRDSKEHRVCTLCNESSIFINDEDDEWTEDDD